MSVGTPTIVPKATATPKPTATPTPKATVTPKPTTAPAIDPVNKVVQGAFPRIGTVTADSLNVRRDAGTTHEAVSKVNSATRVTIYSAKKDASGEYWYQISFTRDGVKQTGYVHSKYIDVISVTSTATPVPTAIPTVVPSKTPTPVPGVTAALRDHPGKYGHCESADPAQK